MQTRMPKFEQTRSFRCALLLVALAVAIQCHSSEKADPPLVFAAASTSDALTEIGKQFEAERKTPVQFSFGASRDLARQIRSGAPADILVSADTETVDALEKDGLVKPSDRRVLMSNFLVVIVPKDVPTGVRAPADLKNVPHLAIGDPATVPAGSYAAKWLKAAGLWDAVQDRLVPSLDVRAALAAVEAGRAEAGIVYRTDAATSAKVRVAFDVPADTAPAISYVAARVKASTNAAAVPFFEYLNGQTARVVFLRHGFALP
jgi:molybdate transport system substrate-binding protein